LVCPDNLTEPVSHCRIETLNKLIVKRLLGTTAFRGFGFFVTTARIRTRTFFVTAAAAAAAITPGGGLLSFDLL
jgi:hypothetical protein